MPEEDISRIKVNNSIVGIVGLKGVLEDMAKDFAHRPDEEVGPELVKRLGKENWIPEESRAKYAQALVREFRKFLGQPVDEGPSNDLEIKVLGPGCAQCNQLQKLVMDVLAEMHLSADLEHVTDVKEIAVYGVMGMPALLINGKVMAVGKVPPKNQIKQWLSEFTA